MTQTLTITNGTVAQKPLLAHKQVYCFCAYESDSIPGTFLYPILRDDGTCVVDSIAGYTKRYEAIQSSKNDIILKCETAIDFTNASTNVNVPTASNSWSLATPDGLEGSQHFFQVVKDENGVVIGTKEHLLYPAELTGACFNKTAKYSKMTQVYEDDDVTLVYEDDNLTKVYEDLI